MSYITLYLANSRQYLVPVPGSRNFSSVVCGGPKPHSNYKYPYQTFIFTEQCPRTRLIKRKINNCSILQKLSTLTLVLDSITIGIWETAIFGACFERWRYLDALNEHNSAHSPSSIKTGSKLRGGGRGLHILSWEKSNISFSFTL